MKIKFYNVVDSDNTINKTLLNGLEINLNIKKDFNIRIPELIILNTDSLDINNYNYFFIPDLNIYYFINSIESIGNKLFKVLGYCDVLETYKNDILNSTAMFKRKMETGDYFNGDLEFSTEKTVEKHISNKGFDGAKSLIMTTLGA